MSAALRVLLAVIGAAAVASGTMVVAYALRGFDGSTLGPALARVLVIVIAALAMLGGMQLLRGALRGRIVHRRNAPSRRDW